jgi:hypothetical protein
MRRRRRRRRRRRKSSRSRSCKVEIAPHPELGSMYKETLGAKPK